MDGKQSLEQVPQGYATRSNQFTHAQKRFYASDLCKEARELLQALVNSQDYNTDPSPLISNPVPFVERHLHHLSIYPKTDLCGYMSNLRLMTSLKHSRPTR